MGQNIFHQRRLIAPIVIAVIIGMERQLIFARSVTPIVVSPNRKQVINKDARIY